MCNRTSSERLCGPHVVVGIFIVNNRPETMSLIFFNQGFAGDVHSCGVSAASRWRPLERCGPYAASVATSIGSIIDGSSFSGLLTRVEIGHIRIKSAANGRMRSRGSGSSLSQRA